MAIQIKVAGGRYVYVLVFLRQEALFYTFYLCFLTIKVLLKSLLMDINENKNCEWQLGASHE